MKIKRHLPCAPFPATKAFKSDHFYVNSHGDIVYNDTSPLREVAHIGQAVTEQSKINAHAGAIARKNKRWEIIREMMQQGATHAEMAEATGYARGSIGNIIKKMRDAGVDLPELKRGPK